jgi:hypothetical protein
MDGPARASESLPASTTRRHIADARGQMLSWYSTITVRVALNRAGGRTFEDVGLSAFGIDLQEPDLALIRRRQTSSIPTIGTEIRLPPSTGA